MKRIAKSSSSLTTYDCNSGAYLFIFEEDTDINLKEVGVLWENRMRINIYETMEYSIEILTKTIIHPRLIKIIPKANAEKKETDLILFICITPS